MKIFTVVNFFSSSFLRHTSYIILFVTSSIIANAQAGEWTWMKGSSSGNSAGVFGTQGVGAPTNTPPGFYEPITWTDNQHNFWLFGGVQGSIYGDLWKYDVSTNYWTWMEGNGSLNVPGNYGTQGVPSPNNHPGARAYGGLGWVDSLNNLWMFAGWGYDAAGTYGPLGDLWMYNTSTNEWTWMKGSTQGYSISNYGTIQVSSPTNEPGNRYEFNAGWSDDNFNLWLFGGESQQGFGINLSDVWKYDLSSNEWTWMQGADASAGYQAAVYGTMGVSSPLNTPGSRSVYCVSKDLNGKFWMFGGYYTFPSPAYDDLWMFDPLSLEWTWMGGTTIQNDAGSYQAQCDTSPQLAASRYENRSNWTDDCGNLWTFGGVNSSSGALTDLWVHQTATDKWIWAKGSSSGNVNPVYGTQGVSNPANIPGGRSGSGTWTGSDGSLWLFGGFDFNYSAKNDLWRFVRDSLCTGGSCLAAQQPVIFSSSDTDVCQKFCVDFFDSSLNNPTAWLWIFEGGAPATSTLQNPPSICYNLPGVYDVTLITTTASGNDTLTLSNYITVYATPPFPTITQVGYTLTSSVATSYQWQFNSVDISGATNQSYTVLQTGYYTVIVSDSNGCVNSATQYILIDGIDDMSDANIFIYPNPSSGNFIIELQNGRMAGEVSIDVVNTLGQKVFSTSEKNFADGSQVSSPNFQKEIELGDIARGVYFIEIKTENEFVMKKILIE